VAPDPLVRVPLEGAAAHDGDFEDRDLARPVGQRRAIAQRRAERLNRGPDLGADEQRVERPVQTAFIVRERERTRAARARTADDLLVELALRTRERLRCEPIQAPVLSRQRPSPN
jgi:hypothetical protein